MLGDKGDAVYLCREFVFSVSRIVYMFKGNTCGCGMLRLEQHRWKKSTDVRIYGFSDANFYLILPVTCLQLP